MRFMQGPGNQPTLVVGAAIVRGSRVLATRRTRPPEAAGRWELPGGKVEPGEDAKAALVREIREELGCEVRVTGALAGEQPVGDGLTLCVLLAELTGGDPTPHEHDALRWLAPDELDTVTWLAPDRPFLAELGELLRTLRDGEP
jgi:8-oxo-dGTP diphosphatase